MRNSIALDVLPPCYASARTRALPRRQLNKTTCSYRLAQLSAVPFLFLVLEALARRCFGKAGNVPPCVPRFSYRPQYLRRACTCSHMPKPRRANLAGRVAIARTGVPVLGSRLKSSTATADQRAVRGRGRSSEEMARLALACRSWVTLFLQCCWVFRRCCFTNARIS